MTIKHFTGIKALLLLASLGACILMHAGQYEDSIIASVDGAPITLYDIVTETIRSEFRKSAFMSGQELKNEVLEKRKVAVEELVDRKLLYKEFKAKEYKLPNQYIESLMDDICSEIAGGDRKKLIKTLEESGSSMEEFREKVYEKAAVDIIVNEFCRKTINITPQALHEYYENNKSDFSVPSKIELQILFMDKNGKNKDRMQDLIGEIAKDCLKADEDIFTTLVKLYSEGPGAKDGGRTGWIELKNMRPEFKSSLKDIALGRIGEPVNTDEGVYVVRVSGQLPESVASYESVEEEIRKKLFEKEFKRKYDEFVSKLKAKSVIRYFYDKDNP